MFMFCVQGLHTWLAYRAGVRGMPLLIITYYVLTVHAKHELLCVLKDSGDVRF